MGSTRIASQKMYEACKDCVKTLLDLEYVNPGMRISTNGRQKTMAALLSNSSGQPVNAVRDA